MGSHESVQKGMLQKIYAKTWWRVGNLSQTCFITCRYTVQIGQQAL